MKPILKNKKASAGAVGTIIAILIVIVVGLLVYWNISSSIATGSTEGAIVHSSVNNTSQTVFTLAPIVAIVFIASIVLAYVARFGGAANGGM